MDKLLNCPFCGGEARITHYEMGFGVYCRNVNCLIELAAFYPTEEQAIAAWNRRSEPQGCEGCLSIEKIAVVETYDDKGNKVATICDPNYCPMCGRRVE